MTRKWILPALAAAVLASMGASVVAEETSAKNQPAEKIAVPTIVQPNELRSYRLSVAIEGCVGVAESRPVVVNAVNTMKVLHHYGRREGDGMLQMDITALDVQATINGEKSPASPDQFPKFTLLLDRSWKIYRMFGIEGTHYAGQVPGLNYANLILLFNVPDLDKGHALGESWASKVKLPGKSEEIKLTSTIKSRDVAARTVTVRQVYAFNDMKLEGDRTVKSTATVDSVFDAVTGKLLKSHAECQLAFDEPLQPKPENRHYTATSRIDIALEK